ncbi:hypothetical protein B0T16DRAFT_390013 [Cercophora newfieldiana]|uniref:Uncharacterized protein n=1 Tax=Cercophora newfieldiana TaxID=92897 RepID=A0AA40CNR6_9PEZI|nr:hypothetical protein B0T16DRAFT_390013 [Cercophora newfieldiana]
MSTSPNPETPVTTRTIPNVRVTLLNHKDVVAALNSIPDPTNNSDPDTVSTPSGGPGSPADPTTSTETDNKSHILSPVALDTSWPYGCVGKIFAGRSPDFDNPIWFGTGVVVGPNVVLTAARIFPWSEPNRYLRFVPAYRNGIHQLGDSYVSDIYGYGDSVTSVSGLDYMVCRLIEPLGRDWTGWIGTWASGRISDYSTTEYSLLGYPAHPSSNPSGVYMDVQHEIRTKDILQQGTSQGLRIYTDARALTGGEGGPLWALDGNRSRVIGVMSGPDANSVGGRLAVVAGGIAMVDLVKYGLQNWPV